MPWTADKPDLAALIARPPWAKDGLCLEYPAINWFPSQGGAVEPAKSICAQCMVHQEWLAWAVEHQEVGVWGGTSKKERRLVAS